MTRCRWTSMWRILNINRFWLLSSYSSLWNERVLLVCARLSFALRFFQLFINLHNGMSVEKRDFVSFVSFCSAFSFIYHFFLNSRTIRLFVAHVNAFLGAFQIFALSLFLLLFSHNFFPRALSLSFSLWLRKQIEKAIKKRDNKKCAQITTCTNIWMCTRFQWISWKFGITKVTPM